MGLLIVGLALFVGIHLLPALAPGLRATLVDRLGPTGYRGVFSLWILLGLVCIVLGWRSAVPAALYPPPPALAPLALGLLGVSFLLLAVSLRPSRLQRLVRHPQLTAVALWALAHLLLNGDNLALALFAGLGLWSLLEMALLNRRPATPRPAAPGWGAELLTLALAAALFAGAAWLHPWFTGRAAL